MKRQHQRRKPATRPLVWSMIDLFALSLMSVLLKDPAFGVQSQRLPALKAAPAAKASARPARQVCIRRDGVTLWNGQVVPAEGLAERVARETPPGESVALIVETDGRVGGAAALLALMTDCARLGLGDRVRVLHRPTVGK